MKNFFSFNNRNNSNNLNNSGYFNDLNNFNNLSKSKGKINRIKLKPILIFLILVFTCIVFLYVFNSKQSAYNPVDTVQSSSHLGGFDLIIKFILGLIIVTALIYITVFILKFFYAKKNKLNISNKYLSSGLINILESINLDINKKLHLVKIADKVFLLSSTDNQINLITELQKEEIEKVSIEIKENNNLTEVKNFRSVFSGFFKNNIWFKRINNKD